MSDEASGGDASDMDGEQGGLACVPDNDGFEIISLTMRDQAEDAARLSAALSQRTTSMRNLARSIFAQCNKKVRNLESKARDHERTIRQLQGQVLRLKKSLDSEARSHKHWKQVAKEHASSLVRRGIKRKPFCNQGGSATNSEGLISNENEAVQPAANEAHDNNPRAPAKAPIKVTLMANFLRRLEYADMISKEYRRVYETMVRDKYGTKHDARYPAYPQQTHDATAQDVDKLDAIRQLHKVKEAANIKTRAFLATFNIEERLLPLTRPPGTSMPLVFGLRSFDRKAVGYPTAGNPQRLSRRPDGCPEPLKNHAAYRPLGPRIIPSAIPHKRYECVD